MPGLPKFGDAKNGATDFFQLSLAYAKQEAWEPIVRQLKTMGKGIIGAVLLAGGTVLLALGFVRALQAEFGSSRSALGGAADVTLGNAAVRGVVYPSPYGYGSHLSGDWSWVPYMGGALFCLLVAGFCVTRILKGAK